MKRTLIISLLLVSGKILAQGIQSELYQYNYSFVHPAFAGREGQKISMLGTTATYGQTFGDDKPTMVLMSYENYFEKVKSAVAVTGYSRRVGPLSLSSLAISYNYRFKVGASSELITSTRLHRHFYSASYNFRSIDPSDPILNADYSASNWAADLGAMLQVKEFYFGLLANSLLHSNNTGDMIGAPNELRENSAAIIGGSFVLGEHLKSQHSLYVPLDDEGCRIDLNNTLIIRDLFLAGLSIERSNQTFFVRGNAGLKVKDYFQIVVLIYSDKRHHVDSPKFRGELLVGFHF